MKQTIGNLFEPLLFAVFLLSAALMALSSARRRRYKLMASRTGCGFLKALRYTSKRAVSESPLFVPGALAIAAVIGWPAGGFWGALVGVGAMLIALAILPVVAPLPSVAAELSGIQK